MWSVHPLAVSISLFTKGVVAAQQRQPKKTCSPILLSNIHLRPMYTNHDAGMWRVLRVLLLCSVFAGTQLHVLADNNDINIGLFNNFSTDSSIGSFILPRTPNLVFLNSSLVNISVTAKFKWAGVLQYQRGRERPRYLGYCEYSTPSRCNDANLLRQHCFLPLAIFQHLPTGSGSATGVCFPVRR
jgi:hypothetical protein